MYPEKLERDYEEECADRNEKASKTSLTKRHE